MADGDTFLQRYDLLRVYPNDLTQINQHTEIISFLCESFVNLDGRYDKNRYNTDSTYATPQNYGLVNGAYSQANNYFNYSAINVDLFSSYKFGNTVLWSGIKKSGSLVDA